MNEEEIGERMEGIISFSELGDFIDRPLRTYSCGMHVRLGFAVATSVSPDLLIVDEALSVGDAYFQQKCIRRIKEFKARGVTILFVSHDPGMVKTLCDEALLLDEGRLVDVGKPDDVLEYYTALIAKKTAQRRFFTIDRRLSSPDRRVGHRSGNFQAVITDVHILNTSRTGGGIRVHYSFRGLCSRSPGFKDGGVFPAPGIPEHGSIRRPGSVGCSQPLDAVPCG